MKLETIYKADLRALVEYQWFALNSRDIKKATRYKRQHEKFSARLLGELQAIDAHRAELSKAQQFRRVDLREWAELHGETEGDK